MTATTTTTAQDHPSLSTVITSLVVAWSSVLDHGPDAAVPASTLLIAEGLLVEALDADEALSDALLDDAGTLLDVVRLVLVAGGDAYTDTLTLLDVVRANLAAART